MNIYVYKHIYIYMYIYIYTYIMYMYIHIYIYLYIYTCISKFCSLVTYNVALWLHGLGAGGKRSLGEHDSFVCAKVIFA